MSDEFKPYVPPNDGDGPIDNASRDLLHRLYPEGPHLVTPQAVAMVAWLLTWGHLKAHEEDVILRGLGLEWRRNRMGALVLCPRKEHTQ